MMLTILYTYNHYTEIYRFYLKGEQLIEPINWCALFTLKEIMRAESYYQNKL